MSQRFRGLSQNPQGPTDTRHHMFSVREGTVRGTFYDCYISFAKAGAEDRCRPRVILDNAPVVAIGARHFARHATRIGHAYPRVKSQRLLRVTRRCANRPPGNAPVRNVAKPKAQWLRISDGPVAPQPHLIE